MEHLFWSSLTSNSIDVSKPGPARPCSLLRHEEQRTWILNRRKLIRLWRLKMRGSENTSTFSATIAEPELLWVRCISKSPSSLHDQGNTPVAVVTSPLLLSSPLTTSQLTTSQCLHTLTKPPALSPSIGAHSEYLQLSSTPSVRPPECAVTYRNLLFGWNGNVRPLYVFN